MKHVRHIIAIWFVRAAMRIIPSDQTGLEFQQFVCWWLQRSIYRMNGRDPDLHLRQLNPEHEAERLRDQEFCRANQWPA